MFIAPRRISPMASGMDDVCAQVGEERIQALVGAFYRRVKTDDLIGPMYPADDWAGAEFRLSEFLIFRLGGPPRYLEERGHPRLRMRHFPFAIGEAERQRWLTLMESAMNEIGLPVSHPEIAERLQAFFAQVAEAMQNR
jgi:hemoglobin